MKKHLILAGILLLAIAGTGNVRAQGNLRSSVAVVKQTKVFPQEVIGTVSPLMWGTNFLFWVEDDEALQDGVIETKLKEIPCKFLRYPGGTVADNFHWKTNLLDNNNRFPYEEGETETDFDEFMAFCSRIGAEAILVVNTESWFIRQDVEGGAREAADWVKYCKTKGYKVRYWEIGNETYWHPFMTATEYANVVKTYAQAMKAEDPDILIGANGHNNVDFVGTKERTDPSQWETIRQMYLNINSREETKAADEYADSYENENTTDGTIKWWNEIANICGEYIDMIVIHWYYTGSNNQAKQCTSLQEVENVFKKKYPGKNFLMAMTEYNCNHTTADLRIAGFFDGIGRFLEAGVDMANFWPLRNGIDKESRSILSMTGKTEIYPFQIFKMMAGNLKGNLLKCTSSDNQIYTYASDDGSQLTVFVTGRGLTTTAADITLEIGTADAAFKDAFSYYPNQTTFPITLKETEVAVTPSGQGIFKFTINPLHAVMLRFTRDGSAIGSAKNNTGFSISVQEKQLIVSSESAGKMQIYNLAGMNIVSEQVERGITPYTIPEKGHYIVYFSSPEIQVSKKLSIW